MDQRNTHDELHQVEKLQGSENFQLWKFQVTIILKANDLYKNVVGPVPDPITEAWTKKDALAQKIIVLTLDKKVVIHIMSCERAMDMWNRIHALYQRKNEQLKCNLLQEFFSYSFTGTIELSIHISKLENMAVRLNALETKITDSMLVSKVLTSLPDTYKHFVSAWESTEVEQRTLENLIARLIMEETRLKKTSEEKEGSVALRMSEVKCYKCNGMGHISRNCKILSKNYNTNNYQEKKCFNCGGYGHFSSRCVKPVRGSSVSCSICKKNNHQDKDCFFRNKSRGSMRSNLISFLARNTRTNNWIVDSGTTSHMVNDRSLITNMKNINTTVEVAKIDETMSAEGVGQCELRQCNLKNVIYVPELAANLLSVTAITETGGNVKFLGDKVKIDKNGTEIVGRKNEKGLFEINLGRKREQFSYLATSESSVEKWHRRLGHLSLKGMRNLMHISAGMNIKKSDLDKFVKTCDTCCKAKHMRESFRNDRTRATRPLELVHTDVCGPIGPDTWDGKRYILTFLDDFTHFAVIYLLRTKCEVAEKVKEYVNAVEAKWNTRLSKLRSDNGREYVNNNLADWCKLKGIELDRTIPYTPQLNGRAERLNRSLIEKTRALLIDSGLEKEMWGEAAYTATYLLNRSPTSVLDTTPAEAWDRKEPNLKNIKMFGCTVFAKVMEPKRKLDERSKRYILVGYAPYGYRLWDADNRKIKIERNVIVDEEMCKKTGTTQNEETATIWTTGEHKEQNTEDRNDIEEESSEDMQEAEEQNEYEEAEQIEQRSEQIEQRSEQRRSSRTRNPPKRFDDYVALLTYNEAVTGIDKTEWTNAIEEEKRSLKKNDTWKIISRDEVKNKKLLTSRWVFKEKENGEKKTRLVVRGCQQESGIDYMETFSPVIGNSSLRVLFALAATREYKIITFDVKTAFLYGQIDEDIYMLPPEGYDYGDKVCKLKKALYGLKQAPLKWNEKLTQFLKERKLEKLKTEQCIFKQDNNDIILGIYVDDGILLGKNLKQMNHLLDDMKKVFEIKVCKNPSVFLGMEVCIEKKIKLTQTQYSKKILERYRMEDSKSVSTPIVKGSEEDLGKRECTFPYREVIGSLLYLSSKTRPDLTYATNYGSRYINEPKKGNVTDAKRMLRYLNGTSTQGIQFCKSTNSNIIEAYCDADHAGDSESRKSTTGYVIMYGGGPISWCSRKQAIVALSTTEAEYIAAAECCKELLHLKTLLQELTNQDHLLKLKIDNQSAIQLIQNGVVNKRSKHIDVKYHFIHELIKNKQIIVEYCKTELQYADLFTKALNSNKFIFCKNGFVV